METKIKLHWIVLPMVLVIIASCNTQEAAKKPVEENSGKSIQEVNLNQQFQLVQGQSVKVNDKNIIIALDSLEMPFGNEARFAGIATVNATSSNGQTKQFRFQLENTPDYDFNFENAKITFQGYSDNKVNLIVS